MNSTDQESSGSPILKGRFQRNCPEISGHVLHRQVALGTNGNPVLSKETIRCTGFAQRMIRMREGDLYRACSNGVRRR